jgi:hypothetical protein
MPIPRAIGRWNKVGLNRVTRRIHRGCRGSVSSWTVVGTPAVSIEHRRWADAKD